MVFLFPLYLYWNNIIEKLRKKCRFDVKWYRTAVYLILKPHELQNLLDDIETIVDKVVIIDKGGNLIACWLMLWLHRIFLNDVGDVLIASLFFFDDVGDTYSDILSGTWLFWTLV